MPRTHKYVLALLIGVSLIVSFTELRGIDDPGVFLRSDSMDYLSLAKNLFTGNGYRITEGTTFISDKPTSYRTPGYPAFLLVFLYLFGTGKGVTAAILYQHLLLALFPVVVYFLCRALSKNGRLALLGAALSLLFSPLRDLATTIHPEFLATLLIGFGLLCLLQYIERRNIYLLVGFSLLLVAAILVKQNLAALALLFAFPLPLVATKRDYAVSLSLVLLLIAPWVVRSSLLHEKPLLFTTNGGLNFYLANEPRVEMDSNNKGQFDGAMRQLMAKGLTEIQADGELYRIGFSLARQNGIVWQLRRLAQKAGVTFRDYYPPVRNEIFFLLLPFALIAGSRRWFLVVLVSFQALNWLCASSLSWSLSNLLFANSLDVTALHFIGWLGLLLMHHDLKAKCVASVAALILLPGLVYIPIDRATIMADALLVPVYALAPQALRWLYPASPAEPEADRAL